MVAQNARQFDNDEDDILEDDEEVKPNLNLELGITALQVTSGIHRTLIKAGLSTLRDVTQKPKSFFHNLQGMGYRKVHQLQNALNEYDLDFSPEPKEWDEEEEPPKRKLHWTQTPEGKRKITRHLKRISKLKRGQQPVTNGIPNWQLEQEKDGLFHCPECSLSYTTLTGIANHRRYQHGVRGTANTREARLAKINQGGKKRGRRNDSARNDRPTDSVVAPTTEDTNPTQEELNHDFYEYAAGYAEGHIRTWIDFYCQQTGGRLSPNLLTRRLAELLGG